MTRWKLRDEPFKDSCRMLLFVAIAAKADKDVVRWFELLKDRYADLVIPFDKIVAIGRSYLAIGEFERGLEISRAEYERLAAAGLTELAPYALSLAYRIRYTLDLNAREAMHLIELRSGREGHPAYRAVAQAMHERIAAVHPGVAAAMAHVDTSVEPRLERIMSEIRTHRKRAEPLGRD